MTVEGFCLLYMMLEFCLLTQLGGKTESLTFALSALCLPSPLLPLTWLWTVFSWLLKVMVRLVDVLGATCVMKGVLLWFTVSYMYTRRLQISMFWKHDLTLFMHKAETRCQGESNMELQGRKWREKKRGELI